MKFRIKVCQALLKRDLRSFSDMNPYVQIQIGHIKKKTSINFGGGKKPRWNQSFEVDLPKKMEIEVTVQDEGTFGEDPIGRGWFDLEISKPNQIEDKMLQIFYDGKVVGKIKLQITQINSEHQQILEENEHQENAKVQINNIIAKNVLKSLESKGETKRIQTNRGNSNSDSAEDMLSSEVMKYQSAAKSDYLGSPALKNKNSMQNNFVQPKNQGQVFQSSFYNSSSPMPQSSNNHNNFIQQPQHPQHHQYPQHPQLPQHHYPQLPQYPHYPQPQYPQPQYPHYPTNHYPQHPPYAQNQPPPYFQNSPQYPQNINPKQLYNNPFRQIPSNMVMQPIRGPQPQVIAVNKQKSNPYKMIQKNNDFFSQFGL